MILVDTSIWVDHFRSVNARLFDLLNKGEVLVHPFILGELALGNLRNRAQILELLCKLPELPVAEHNEVLALVDNRRFYGGGIGSCQGGCRVFFHRSGRFPSVVGRR